ncbi:MAG: glycosyltransferase [Candidatus Acidiferrales bacterium]
MANSTKPEFLDIEKSTACPDGSVYVHAVEPMRERKRLRVLHIVGSMDPGGVETWLLNVLKYIDRDLLQLHFCACGTGAGLYSREVARLGGIVVRCPKRVNLWSFRRSFRKMLREGRYDVVHSHVYLFSGLLLRWAKDEGIPIRIAHCHTCRDDKPDTQARRFYRHLMKAWINRYATCGLATSEPAAVELFGENWNSEGRFRVLHCGIDLSAFDEPIDRNAIRKEVGLPLDAPVVGHVANFLGTKNHAFIIEIVAQVLRTNPEIHFLFVGDGPLRPRIQAEARTRGLSNHMHFVGTRTDVPRLMRGAMDLFLFPSINEGFGVSLLEAQAAGLSCLVSDTIPREVSCFRGLVEFLPLSAGIDYWVRQLISRLNLSQSRISSPDDDSRTNISVQQSVRDLTDLYFTARTQRIPQTSERHV